MEIAALRPDVVLDISHDTADLVECDNRFFRVERSASLVLNSIRRNAPCSFETIANDVAALDTATVRAIIDALPGRFFHEPPETETSLARSRRTFLWSATLIRADAVARIAERLTWMFRPPCVVLWCSSGLAALVMTVAIGAHAAVPFGAFALLEIYGLVLLSMLAHEFGHATAARHFGAPPSDIGIGLYFVFPVLYSDVTSSWRLSRMQRATVDVAGAYFQLPVAAIAFVLLALTHDLVFLFLNLTIVAQFVLNAMPFLKFDGYWLLSDLAAIPNLHRAAANRVRSISRDLRVLFKKRSRTALILDVYVVLFAAAVSYWIGTLLQGVGQVQHHVTAAGSHLWPAVEAVRAGQLDAGAREVVSGAFSLGNTAWIVLAVLFAIPKLVRWTAAARSARS